MARAERAPLTGELRMGVIPTIAPFLLPTLLPQLRAEWPTLKLYLREDTSQAACDALQRGQLDCVLLAMPFACGEVDFQELFADDLLVAFPKGEEPRAAEIAPEEIAPGRLLLLEDGHCLKDHALSACNRPELRASAMMMGTSLHTLVQMVDNGLGVTMVPRMAVDAGVLAGTSVSVRRLQADHAYRSIALIWRRGSPRAEEFRLLGDALRRHHAALSPDRASTVPG
jgi:LysR family hydrogen peroxide-inducible transcriptional activator